MDNSNVAEWQARTVLRSRELLEAAGFEVEPIHGDDCPDPIRPVVGPLATTPKTYCSCVVRLGSRAGERL